MDGRRITAEGADKTPRRRVPAAAVIAELRLRQWTKNLIVFAALIFSNNLGAGGRVALAAAAFGVFCGLSGAVYLINDSVDADRDRLHAKKRLRPIAAGELSVRAAVVTAVVIAAAALTAAAALGWPLFATAASFFVLLLAYSLVLKHLVILDTMTIAAGFVLRVVGGAVVIDVPISPWLILCTALVALFLGLVKRRSELAAVENPMDHRPILEHYSKDLLDSMISIVAAATIVAYSLYTFFTHDGGGAVTGEVPAGSATGGGGAWMMLTIPFVVYGIFRYLYLVHLKDLGGNPEEILVSDLPLIVDIVLFVIVAAGVLQLT